MAPQWFRENSGRYDNYPRTGPKVFAGEYAAQSVGIASADNRNNWECALSEAAFITGLERNSDVVRMSSYAPLFGHVDAWQWTPNMIWFDNLRSYGTPNYYVQKMFSVNKGTQRLPVLIDDSPKNGQFDLYVSGSRDEIAGEVILKVVNTGSSSKDLQITMAGVNKGQHVGRAIVLQSEDLKTENSLDHPTKLAPVEKQLQVTGSDFSYSVLPRSFTVLRIPLK